MKIYLFILALIVPISTIYSQSAKIDSLYKKLQTDVTDEEKVNIYYSLSRKYWHINTDSSLKMADKSIELAKKIKFSKGLSLGLLTKGVGLTAKGKYPEALSCLFDGVKISEQLKLDGLSLNFYSNIGIAYVSMKDYKKAISAFEKGLSYYDKKYPIYDMLINIGDAYSKDKNYDLALKYEFKALHECSELKDSNSIAIALFNIAENYQKKGDQKNAATYVSKSLEISKKINDIEGLAYSYQLMARIAFSEGKYEESIKYADYSLKNLQNIDDKELELEIYEIFYDNYFNTKDYKKALSFRNRYMTLKDSIFNIDKEVAIKNLQNSFQSEKNQIEIEILQKDKVFQNEQIKRRNLEVIMLIAFLIILLFAVYFLIINIKQKQQSNLLLQVQKEEIQAQNEEIKAQNEELIRKDDEIILKNEKLTHLNNTKTKLFSIISHDLKGPISNIQGVLFLVAENLIDKIELENMLKLLAERVLYVSALLDNLLYWAKSQMEDGYSSFPQKIDLKQIIFENTKILQPQAEGKSILITSNIPDLLFGFADYNHISFIIRNIISNAIKFTPNGGFINLNASVNNNQIQIVISDTGKGIPPEDVPKIFDSHTNYTTLGTAFEKGTGLGLIICEEFIRKNNGRIWVESQVDNGTSFFIEIPAFSM